MKNTPDEEPHAQLEFFQVHFVCLPWEARYRLSSNGCVACCLQRGDLVDKRWGEPPQDQGQSEKVPPIFRPRQTFPTLSRRRLGILVLASHLTLTHHTPLMATPSSQLTGEQNIKLQTSNSCCSGGQVQIPLG